MKNLIFTISLLFTFCLSGFSQESATMEMYLETALNDQSLELYQAQLSFLKSNKYNSPWLNRVEFRLGSEDANISMNEYRLRLSPSNPAEVKANKLYYNKHVKNIGTQYKVAMNEALRNRYQMLIEYHYLVHSLELNSRNLKVMNEIARSMSLMGLENIDAGTIIGIQSDQTDLMLKAEDLKAQESEVTYYIQLDLKDLSLIGLAGSKMIDVAEIKSYLDANQKAEGFSSLYVLEAEEDLQLKQQMMKIDKAEARSNIGYIQGNFDTERGNELNEHFGFQVGVRLPLVNPDKPDLNRKRVELIEDQKDLEAKKDFVIQKNDMSLIQIRHLITQYELLHDRAHLAQSISLQSASGIDLSDVSKAKKYQFSIERQQLVLEKQIRELFIEYLDLQGILVQDPVINYMSSDFKVVR